MTKEFLLEIGDFDVPKELKGIYADAQQIINLLFLNPGTYQTFPEMGIGLDKYRYDIWDSVLSTKINQKIRSQIMRFLPHLASAEVEVTQNNGILGIGIQINNELVLIKSTKKDDTISIELASHNFKEKQ